MTSQLFIERREADLTSDLSSLLTFEIDNIRNFASRSTTWSKTIVLPGTSRNNKIFGHIFQIGIGNSYDSAQDNVGYNFNASVSANCILFQNNIQIFKGTLRLLEIIIDKGRIEYEVGVFGEIAGLVLSMANKKLEELDFSAYDHNFNETNIINSWDAAPGSGYFYPLADVGGVSIDKVDYDIHAFRPAIYVKEYIDKIFESANFRYTSNLFDTTRFKRLAVPFNQKGLRSAEFQLVDATRTDNVMVVDNNITQANLPFQTFTGNAFTTNGDKSEFTYTGVDTISAKIKFRVEGLWQATFAPIYLRLRKNNVEVIPGTLKILDVSPSPSQPYVWEKEVTITLATNDYIALWYFWGTVPIASPNNALAGHSTLTVESLTVVYDDIDYNDPVEMNITIPKNVLQKDFLSSIIQLFNLYVYEDPLENRLVRIEPYVDFYSIVPTDAIDWSYKVNRDKPLKIKPMSELNSRYYEFKFKSDTDYYNDLYRKKFNKGYGDHIFDSAFEFATEKSTIELIFSATVLVGYNGTDKVVSAFFKMNSGVEERIDTNIRIIQTKKITGVTAWKIKDGTTVLTTITNYGYGGHYDDPDAPSNDIHFGVPSELYFILVGGGINVTQFNVYWSAYLAEITDKDSKLLTAWFKLTPNDIMSLDFRKKIWVDGVLYRLSSIIDYNASNPSDCQIDLLKVNYLLY